MTKLSELKAEFLSDPDNQVAYEALAPEFDLARKLIAARVAAGLSQTEVAERMGTKQSEVSTDRRRTPEHQHCQADELCRGRWREVGHSA